MHNLSSPRTAILDNNINSLDVLNIESETMSTTFIKLSQSKIDAIIAQLNGPNPQAEYNYEVSDCAVIVDDTEIDLTTLVTSTMMLTILNNEVFILMPILVSMLGMAGWTSVVEQSQESTGMGPRNIWWKFKLIRPTS